MDGTQGLAKRLKCLKRLRIETRDSENEAATVQKLTNHPQAIVVIDTMRSVKRQRSEIELCRGSLINNAAITNSGGKSAEELTPATWDAVMNVNVRGAWLMSVACLPHLKESGRGAIVNIASDTAMWGAPKLLAYVASKGAVIAMTRSLAREFGTSNVTVNAIAPGLTEVEATAYVPAERHEYYLKGRALTHAQLPDDVNGPMLFLLSDAARFVTGQLLPVNRGFVMN
ncbi:3-oxoacyl-[acyl-carrier protein] reductase [Candidatus Paraburkholderia schumanniana]|nr:3-oxoacyl-[acyl-carrier protein] reductase [Candidatus Paraburkholderia schumannianae]